MERRITPQGASALLPKERYYNWRYPHESDFTAGCEGQGKKGQMVEVSEGYARNFLLPRKLAIAATADAINTMNLKEEGPQG